jgi:diguanylate cyclase (GGDEF)-like protein
MARRAQRLRSGGPPARFQSASLGPLTEIKSRSSSPSTENSGALTDELTQLCNRQGFMVVGDQLLERCVRCSPWTFLIYLKVEHLIVLNHTWGPGTGDLLLARTAALLRVVFRPPALIGRVGGDEFAVLANALRPADCTTLLTSLSAGIDASNMAANGPLLTLSGGLSQFNARHPGSIAQRLAQAHKAMLEERHRPWGSLH